MSEPFNWSARVYYEDTDVSGVMYHARYLHFFERARTEWLRKLGGSQQNLKDSEAVVFTVANLEIEYLRPARLDDCVRVSVSVEQQRGASLVFGQVMALDHSPSVPLARVRVRVGCVDAATFRPRRLPSFISSSNGVCV